MRMRIALAALAAAFCFASVAATIATVHEVKTHTSSLSRPVTRI